MSLKDSENRLQGLEAIKRRALDMAQRGDDAFAIRGFIKDAQEELAYAVPSTEKYKKAKGAVERYKGMAGDKDTPI